MIAKHTKALLMVALAVTQLFSVSCEKVFNNSSEEEDRARMVKLRNEILALSQSVPCEDPKDWKFMPMGAKACGGPVEYVLYSTKIDTAEFTKRVRDYTAETAALNNKWNFASDCMFVLPPSGVKCENGKAVFIPYTHPQMIVGSWKLTQTLADPGDGSGKYRPVTGPAKYITFDAKGKVSGDAIPQYTGYKILDHERIEFTTPENRQYVNRYKIVGNELELNGPCIEPCGVKFIRM